MPSHFGRRLSIAQRRRARRLGVWNGAVWALGNGLAGTTLILYLAKQLRAERFGLGIGLIVAAPQIVGLLRLVAPWLIGRTGDRKRFCIASYLLAALVLAALPWTCAPGRLPGPGWSLAALVVLWCLYHLLQYLATVGLWSWLADVAALKVRGRFFGRRQRWLVAGGAAGALAAGLFAWGVTQLRPDVPAWTVYATTAELGAAMMIASLAPLLLMPAATVTGKIFKKPPHCNGEAFAGSRISFLTPLQDSRFRRLLVFGCWFSFFNGVTQSAQNYYPMQILGVSLFVALGLQTGMHLGQMGVSPWLGAAADRWGNRRVMIPCQLLVAVGLLFFVVATPGHWAWIVGAWVLWIAYAGLNIGLPNLLLKLAPQQFNTEHIALFYAAGGLCYALSTILGGWLVDSCRDWMFPLLGGVWLGFFPFIFLFGSAARGLGALVLALVMEPNGAFSCQNGSRRPSAKQ